jgi:hypothetical protein
VEQAAVQVPLTQVGVDPLQTLPQAPQLLGSVFSLTQVVVEAEAQGVGVMAGHTQAPPEQYWPPAVAQAVPAAVPVQFPVAPQ